MAGRIISMTETSLSLAAPGTSYTIGISTDTAVLDTGGVRTTSTLLAAGQNVAVWLDGRLPPSALTVQLLPGFSSPEAATTPTGVLEQPTPTGEQRPFGPLSMVTRAGWGAAPAPQFSPDGESGLFDETQNPTGWLVYPGNLRDWLTTVVVHHSALGFGLGPREIQKFHILDRGFADIAYHFVIDGFGQLYEGRILNVRGSHTAGANTGTVGVVLMGNFEQMQPLRAQLTTLEKLITFLASEYAITHVAGHRDFQPEETACPGASIEALVPLIAEDTGLLYGTGGYVDPPWMAG
ncbi:MAG: N-acetylmuramoyl-L-alanine amidase [Anaerolineae bacterium]|nr:N-acetylmuramoyl-L-alanine amidase [Anaerolineae bacterium]